MAAFFDVIVPVFVLISAVWALAGTNQQAALSKWRMLDDPDQAVASAARLYRPGWLHLPPYWSRLRKAEAVIRPHPEAWHRYDMIRRELRAWNLLESAVAIAMLASVLALIPAVVERFS